MLLLIVIILWCEIMNISISLNAQECQCAVFVLIFFIPKSPSIRYAYVYGGNNAAMFSKCRRGRQPKLSYTITQRTHQFHPLTRQRRTRHGMEANKQFWCVFITIKRDFQPPSVAGALRVVRVVITAALSSRHSSLLLWRSEQRGRHKEDASRKGNRAVSRCITARLMAWDVYISTSELRCLIVLLV